MFDKRATLGDSYDDFNNLAVEHTRYYELNTVIVLWLLVGASLAFMVVTGETFATTIDILTS